MKVWITKNALTQGICEVDVDDTKGEVITIPRYSSPWNNDFEFMIYGRNDDWHTTKESAITKAEKMRLKKIESLKKQIVKLENMKFE